MKNVLVITIGNSEIQVLTNTASEFSIIDNNSKLIKEGIPIVNLKPNRIYEDCFLLKSPREDGKTIDTFFNEFKQILCYPLIDPLLEYLKKTEYRFDEVWWVFTDQEKDETVDQKLKQSDTLYFKSIIQKSFQSKYPGLIYKDFAITEHVTNIDFQYKNFYKIGIDLINRNEEISQIFLLPQGGIDQINHALTLQLVQLFKDKVHIYQCAEKSEPVELNFTNLFLQDLTKQNIIKHLHDFDFDKAAILILNNKTLKDLSDYASKRLELLHDFIEDSLVAPEFKLRWENLSSHEKNLIKLQDLVYSFKININQNNANIALIKLFIISENMYKLRVDDYFKIDLNKFRKKELRFGEDVNGEWKEFIIINFGKDKYDYLDKKKLDLSNPNNITINYLFKWLVERNDLDIGYDVKNINSINDLIFKFREARNNIAHNLGSIGINDICNIINKKNINIIELFAYLDAVAFTKDFGIYEKIQNCILNYYGQMM